MKKNYNKYCLIVLIGIISIIPISSYARKVTTSIPVEIKCPKLSTDLAEKYTRDADPKTQLSIAFNGIRAKGYSKGLITKDLVELDKSERKKLSDSDKEILIDIIGIDAVATCTGSSKNIKMKPGVILVCDKGDGLQVELIFPTGEDKRGVFTLTETKDVDDEEENTFIQEKTNVTEASGIEEKLSSKFGSGANGITKTGKKKDCITQ